MAVVEDGEFGSRLVDGEVSDVLLAADERGAVLDDTPRRYADADDASAAQPRRTFRDEGVTDVTRHARVGSTRQDPSTC